MHNINKLFLGADGGGTKCRMRLVDENNNILAEEEINSLANLQIENGEIAYQTIKKLSKIIFRKANLDINIMGKKTSAIFGMAGARLSSAREEFSRREFPFAKILVVDDIDIAREGALLGEDGAVIIIGTGSAGLAMVKGRRLQIGGWGFFIGDHMSGAILGRKLLRKSLLAHEGIIEKTDLTKTIMEQFNNEGEKLMQWSFAANEQKPARPADYASFMPILLDYYEKNDPLALELMDYEFMQIEKYINWFKKQNCQKIAIIGGLGQRIFPLIKKRFGKIIIKARSSPLNGAIILAKKL